MTALRPFLATGFFSDWKQGKVAPLVFDVEVVDRADGK